MPTNAQYNSSVHTDQSTMQHDRSAGQRAQDARTPHGALRELQGPIHGGPPFRPEPLLGSGRTAVKHSVTTVVIEAPIARMPTITKLGCGVMATSVTATCSPSASAHQTRMFSKLRSLTQGLPAQEPHG